MYLPLILIFNGYFSGEDRNFALEHYGAKSKCFDHTDKMWEEMNCQQVRQWQHWGSGCYKYHCRNGRLHIEVQNQTFTCFYPQQEITISLLANSWLHSGSLVSLPTSSRTITGATSKSFQVCPPCEEVCGLDFKRQGYKCKPGVVPPKNYIYHYDSITCAAHGLHPAGVFSSKSVILPSLVVPILLFLTN